MNDAPNPGDGIRRNVEDNYQEYPEDEYGYTYDAWDLLGLSEVDRHDDLIAASLDELQARDLDALDDLEKLAVARGFLGHDEVEPFVEACRSILESDVRHPGIVYPEVAVYAARILARFDRPRALAWLQDFDEQAEELMETRILRGVLEVFVNDSTEALDEIVEEYTDEPELYYEVAEEYLRQEDLGRAREWLDQAREKARSVGDRATQIDIDLLSSKLDASEGE